MLRWAARISCGSACFIASTAAARSPFSIAASTKRTDPRIWVRRDLLIAVRRAILRVAFLAEVVLAMVSLRPSAALRERGRASRARPHGRCNNDDVPRPGSLRLSKNEGTPQRTAAAGFLRRQFGLPNKGAGFHRQRLPKAGNSPNSRKIEWIWLNFTALPAIAASSWQGGSRGEPLGGSCSAFCLASS